MTEIPTLARVMRDYADELSIPIHMLYELSVSSGTFPTMWKQANVILVHKKGSRSCLTIIDLYPQAAHLFKGTGESRV